MTYSNLIQLSIPFSPSAVNYGNCVLFVFLQQSWTIIIIIIIIMQRLTRHVSVIRMTNRTYTVSQNRPPFYFLNNCQKLMNFNNFWYVKSWENLKLTPYGFVHVACQMSPLYLGKSKKVTFQHYYSYTLDYLRYLRRKHTATVVLQL